MRVALLSAGPSLSSSFHPDAAPHDVRIGVNTAASLFACDWWSCADQHRFAEIEPVGTPRLFTIDAEYHKMQSRNGDKVAKFEVQGWKSVFADVSAPSIWQNFSATSALVLARWLGATHLDVYGVDMTGVTCCAGETMAPQRKQSRWERERDLWAEIVNWLPFPVVRHGVQ